MAAEASGAGPVLGTSRTDAGGLEGIPALLTPRRAQPAVGFLRTPLTTRTADLQEVWNEAPGVDCRRTIVWEQQQAKCGDWEHHPRIIARLARPAPPRVPKPAASSTRRRRPAPRRKRGMESRNSPS